MGLGEGGDGLCCREGVADVWVGGPVLHQLTTLRVEQVLKR